MQKSRRGFSPCTIRLVHPILILFFSPFHSCFQRFLLWGCGMASGYLCNIVPSQIGILRLKVAATGLCLLGFACGSSFWASHAQFVSVEFAVASSLILWDFGVFVVNFVENGCVFDFVVAYIKDFHVYGTHFTWSPFHSFV